MDTTKILQQAYNRSHWNSLLHHIFADRYEAMTNPYEESINKNIAKHAFRLGEIKLASGEIIAVYDVELQDKIQIAQNKVAIRNLLKQSWKYYDGAFIASYKTNESDWRFSFLSETKEWTAEGNYEKIKTQAKRYTYLLGENQSCRTAFERFNLLAKEEKTLANIIKAFSVETLTKQFYNELFAWYQWATDEKTGVTFPNRPSTADDDREQIDTKIIRLITRLMFVWFIKQSDLVPNKIFEVESLKSILKDFDPGSPVSGDYYNAILQNLFFATLNRAIVDEEGHQRGFAESVGKPDVKTLYRYAELFRISEDEIISLFSEIPFLNGGLFECLDKNKTQDGVNSAYYHDGFSRNKNCHAFIPNILFFEEEKGLLSILKRYNFTIEENTPQEQQVALDPELLGKVFENLLGAYNPETKETARNQSGSFYTPREIVDYMVDEALITYLGDTGTIRSLFQDEELPEELKNNSTERQAICDKLVVVKILDPACGSGAFPMGLLNRIVEVIQKLSGKSDGENLYQKKLQIIENCIYGVDIQNIATQISKLRFFISLICHCHKDSSKPNFGIPTLPNLETKFVSANSLIEKIKKAEQRTLFEDPQIEITKAELLKIRHDHFSAKSASTKIRLRKRDEALRMELEKLLSENDIYAPEDAKQLAKWDPYDQNGFSSFFDSEWMFNIKEGFDIVIGNPPYIQLQKSLEDGTNRKYGDLYKDCRYKTFERTGDIYCLFYERGIELLKPHGILCYITSNKWMRAGYGKSTRDFFATKVNPKLLIDFAGVKVFESATVDTNILLLTKEPNQHQTACAVTSKNNKDGVKNLSVFVQQTHTISKYSNSDSWVILSPIEHRIKAKIEAVGTPLKDWDIQINYGIKTGCNEAFIITTEKRNEILGNCQTQNEREKTDALIRPILRGRDIKRYSYDWADWWLIATFPSRKYDIDEYPAVKQYFLSFGKERLMQSGEKGSRKKTNNKWFETQDSISYWEDFLKPKIIYPNMTKYMPFYLDKEGYFTNQKCFILTGSNLAYLTTFFNSNVFKICYRDNFPELQGGTRELSKIFFENIRIPPQESIFLKDFEILVKSMQEGEDYSDLALERALLLALELQEFEDFILDYRI